MTRWNNGPPVCPLCRYHHWQGLSDTGLCLRCHRAIHIGGKLYTENEARALLEQRPGVQKNCLQCGFSPLTCRCESEV